MLEATPTTDTERQRAAALAKANETASEIIMDLAELTLTAVSRFAIHDQPVTWDDLCDNWQEYTDALLRHHLGGQRPLDWEVWPNAREGEFVVAWRGQSGDFWEIPLTYWRTTDGFRPSREHPVFVETLIPATEDGDEGYWQLIEI